MESLISIVAYDGNSLLCGVSSDADFEVDCLGDKQRSPSSAAEAYHAVRVVSGVTQEWSHYHFSTWRTSDEDRWGRNERIVSGKHVGAP